MLVCWKRACDEPEPGAAPEPTLARGKQSALIKDQLRSYLLERLYLTCACSCRLRIFPLA